MMPRPLLFLCAMLLGAMFPLHAALRLARVGERDGAAEIQLRAAEAWQEATRNTPLPPGARLRTAGGHLETELDDGSVLRLTGDSLAELSDCVSLSTGQHITLVSLDRGTIYFTARPHTGDTLSIAVPGAQIAFTRRARVRIETSSSWTDIAVLEGSIRFATPSAELDLQEGQLARAPERASSRFQLFREIPPLESDDWSRKRDVAQESTLSARHLPGIHAGAADLDQSGSWLQTDDSGLVWKPKTTDTWAPFQSGTWQWYDELGYTWVAAEPWGWAPYHFGRWLQHASLGWVWVPTASTVFKPGEVYWMRANGTALWGALAPDELWTGRGPARQFAALNTSAASFQPGQRSLDPASPSIRPKDLLTAAQFTVALPSPPLAATRLDAVNEALHATPVITTSSNPAPEVHVSGSSFERRPESTPAVTLQPAPTRTIIVDRPVYVEIPEAYDIYYPVPVYSGFVIMNPAVGDGRKHKKDDAKPTPAP